MMVKVDLATVQKVVAAIKDEHDPQAQRDALMMRDRWLAEVDAGVLEMSAEAREALEDA
jgi:hypothetical protein